MKSGLLLVGASGYLGSLIAVSLLRHHNVRLLTPVREGRDADSVIEPIRIELEMQGVPFSTSLRERIQVVTLPPPDQLEVLDPTLREFGVDQIIHCAGCLDYFNGPALEAVNVEFTKRLLEQAYRVGVERFLYISTAFSCGYVEGIVREALHDEPPSDPTDYTRTKRQAERLIVESGLPFLIIRPSVVIGDSRDGRYSGKRYGLYQLWSGVERLLCRNWHPEMHVFAPEQPACLIHQDAFQNAFLAAYRAAPENSIINFVSDRRLAPSMRQLWRMWFDAVNRPREIIFYDRMADIPVRAIPPAQRALLALASVNMEICGHPWRFETTNLDLLRRNGLAFADASVASVAVCQGQFIRQSAAVEKFLAKFRDQSAAAS
jgi:nucleoside-diphosphate-sugar epimerase